MRKLFGRGIALVVMLLLLGGCAVVNNQETTIEKMKAYAEEKYGQTFQVVEFVEAPDKTYSELLTLTDGKGFVFTVGHNPDDGDFTGLWDDYIEELIDEKLMAQMEQDGILPISGAQVNVRFRLFSFGFLSLEEIREMSIEQLRNDCGVLKVTLFVKLDSSLTAMEDQRDRLFEIFNYMQAMDSRNIGMEVVFATGEDPELENCIDNPRQKFKKEWKDYESVTGWLSLANRYPEDADALASLYQEVG